MEISRRVNKPKGWILSHKVIGEVCITLQETNFTLHVGHIPCKTILITNTSNQSWWPKVPKRYWGKLTKNNERNDEENRISPHHHWSSRGKLHLVQEHCFKWITSVTARGLQPPWNGTDTNTLPDRVSGCTLTVRAWGLFLCNTVFLF